MPENDQYLYRIQPARPEMLSEGMTQVEEGIVDEHFSYLKELTKQGKVFLAGRTLNTDQKAFGIIIFWAATEIQARQVMLDDPAVKKGVMKADLFPFRIALMVNPSNM